MLSIIEKKSLYHLKKLEGMVLIIIYGKEPNENQIRFSSFKGNDIEVPF
jgi:hypothetical protein